MLGRMYRQSYERYTQLIKHLHLLINLYHQLCKHLSGYSTRMPFAIGGHRGLSDIDERDIMAMLLDLEVSMATTALLQGMNVAGLEALMLDGVERAQVELERHVPGRLEAAEAAPQPARLQDGLSHPRALPPARCGSAPAWRGRASAPVLRLRAIDFSKS